DKVGFTIAASVVVPTPNSGVSTTGTATLISGGQILETGTITAATLTGSSVGGATLNTANAVATFGPWSNTGSGLLSFAAGQSFTTAGTVSSAGDVLLANTAADLQITVGAG